MPAPTGAMVLKDALVTVDGIDYANQLNKARLVPDQSVQTMRTLVPDGVVQDVDSATWTWELSGLQINQAGGLAEAIRTAAASGTNITVVLQPKTGVGQKKATFTAIAMWPEFGGEQGSFLPVDMELPVVGAPVFGTS